MTSLPTQPPTPDFEPDAGAIAAAVGTVAERSFYACVDDCDDPDIDGRGMEWLVATVRFDDGPVSGSLACSLPSDLAQLLFDAFSGRDPASPLPRRDQLDDLVGEFSNMVCGTWLSRCCGRRCFRLRPPVVDRVWRPADERGCRRWVAINNRPLAIDWQVERGADGAAMGPRS